ncbi:kell blood group glycoprotein [Chanos chanos]|uniref:Kell blood group glycoprotein n=1 Tax=Chanos chanos TaxID=29144 RepID=A0A6J2WD84_CHACN|nr:kell blood group glycoprotein-like [Chanos chanos]
MPEREREREEQRDEEQKTMDESSSESQTTHSQPESEPQNISPRNKRRKLLLFLFGSSLVAMVMWVGFYFHHRQTPPTTSSQVATPCLSPACLRAAKHVSVASDPFSRPCDYFLFTCRTEDDPSSQKGRQRGRFLDPGLVEGGERRGEDEKRPDAEGAGEERGSFRDRLRDRQTTLLQSMREILESSPSVVSMETVAEKARRFYRTCLGHKASEKRESESFLRLIEQLGGWPVSGVWSQTGFNPTLSVLMGEYNTFPFFNVYVGRDPNDTDRVSSEAYVQIDQPDFQFLIEWNNVTQKSKISSKSLRAFLGTCRQYLGLLGVVDPMSIMLHCGQYISLSTHLVTAIKPLHHRLHSQLLYQRMTVTQLQTLAPAIDWLGSLQATFRPIPINQSDLIFVHNLPYIIHMSKTISQWQEQRGQEQETGGSGHLHTYMILSVLQTLLPALDSRFAAIHRNFSIASGHNTEEDPDWRQCVMETEKGFSLVLSHVIRGNIGQKEAEELIRDIFSSVKMKLANAQWRDTKSRASVLSKVTSLSPRMLTKTVPGQVKLTELYTEVVLSEEDYFSNYLQLLRFQRKRRNRLFSWSSESDILSIRPFLSGNDIIFPLGMFVTPQFHSSYPRALNYGMLGFLMAKDLLRLLLPDIHVQENISGEEGSCVWSEFLRMTKGPGREEEFYISPSEKQELWLQHSALQVALQAYSTSLLRRPRDTSLSGLSYTRLFLSSFTQVSSCDSDPNNIFMPVEPSFLATVVCASSHVCPKSLTCLSKQGYKPHKC